MTVFRFFLAITALWAVPNLAPADIADQVTDFTTTHSVQSLRLPVGTALARTNHVITMSFQK